MLINGYGIMTLIRLAIKHVFAEILFVMLLPLTAVAGITDSHVYFKYQCCFDSTVEGCVVGYAYNDRFL